MADFVAVIANLSSAIKVGVEGGLRLTLDIDEQSRRQIWDELPEWRDKLLRVTIEPDKGGQIR